MKNHDIYRHHAFAAAVVMLLWCAAAFAADTVNTALGEEAW